MLPTKFRIIWTSGFRGEDFQKSTNQKQELPVAAMFVNGSGRNEHSLQRTAHRCFLPSFGSFGQAVSEEKIFKNQQYLYILHFTFLFSLFVFVRAAGHYFRIWTGHYFSIWTGQVPALLFQIKSIIQQIVHVTSGHMAYDPQCHELFAIEITAF